MAETTTIARPYARAAFEQAEGKRGGLKRWSGMLGVAAVVAGDADMRRLLANPKLGAQQKADLLIEICNEIPDSANLTKECQNFIRVLAENRRLGLLPDIYAQFEKLRAEAEKTVHAEMISAFEISDEQRNQIAEGLKTKLKCEVELEVTVDESLLGGAIIRAGDLVIDGSARGRLAKLGTALRQ